MAVALAVYLVSPDLAVTAWSTPTVAAIEHVEPSGGHSTAPQLSNDDCGDEGLTSDEVTVLGRGTGTPQTPDAGRGLPAVHSGAQASLPPGTAVSDWRETGDSRRTLGLLQILRC